MSQLPEDLQDYTEHTQKVCKKLQKENIDVKNISIWQPCKPMVECVIHQFTITEEAISADTEHLERQISHSKAKVMKGLEEFRAGYIGPFEAEVFEGVQKATVQIFRRKTPYEIDITLHETDELNTFQLPIPIEVKERLDLGFDTVRIGEKEIKEKREE